MTVRPILSSLAVGTLAAELQRLSRNELLAFVVPYQAQRERVVALNQFTEAVRHLRHAGWGLRVHTRRTHGGEVFALEVLHRPSDPEEK